MAALTDEMLIFHLPGKHPQKRHGYRMKGDTLSVRSKKGDWVPVKRAGGKNTEFATKKPTPQPKPKPARKRKPKDERPDGTKYTVPATKHKGRGRDIRQEFADIEADRQKIRDLDLQAARVYQEAREKFPMPANASTADRLRIANQQSKFTTERIKPLNEEMDRLAAGLQERTRNALKAKDPLGAPPIYMMNGSETQKMRDGMEFVGSVVDKKKGPRTGSGKPQTVSIKTERGVRAHANPGMMTIRPNEDARTVVHEYGHILEFSNKRMVANSRAWRDGRTQGEPAQKMSKVTGNRGYRDDEVTQPDKFYNPYIGKNYGAGATEVVSMGLERLYYDPVGFANEDPDMFDYVISAVQE
jgi:hypothetical protein